MQARTGETFEDVKAVPRFAFNGRRAGGRRAASKPKAAWRHPREPIADPRDFDVESKLEDAIAALLALALPQERRVLIPKLTNIITAVKGVVEHRGKLWGDLSEEEANVVAHRVGAIASTITETYRSVDATMQTAYSVA